MPVCNRCGVVQPSAEIRLAAKQTGPGLTGYCKDKIACKRRLERTSKTSRAKTK